MMANSPGVHIETDDDDEHRVNDVIFNEVEEYGENRAVLNLGTVNIT